MKDIIEKIKKNKKTLGIALAGILLIILIIVVISIFFVIAMQCSIFENINVIESIRKSFLLVKNNFLDILLKQFALVFIINFFTMTFAMFLNQSVLSIIIFSLVLNIITALTLIGGNLIYKEVTV